MTPGSEAKVFETDFGRLGILICFPACADRDISWPEEWAELKRRGAEIIFCPHLIGYRWPSAYNGGFPLQVYAFLHSYYVISATRDSSRILPA
ncbi:MAG: hypothetical protein U9Q78_06375 [Chloroflexota bacterium]|nr:hypothetical protein [Chloroflexota bacterium]